MRGKSCTRQPLNGAWDATNWDALCGTSWQLVAHELKLTKKVTSDKRGTGRPLPRIVVDKIPEAEPRRFHVLSADIEAHHMKERQNHKTTNVENESERLSREP